MWVPKTNLYEDNLGNQALEQLFSECPPSPVLTAQRPVVPPHPGYLQGVMGWGTLRNGPLYMMLSTSCPQSLRSTGLKFDM